MPELLSIAPLLLAGVLVISGIAKLRDPEDLIGWAELGVPSVLRRAWLLRLHPWAEILLGITLVSLGGVLGEIASIIALVVMLSYLIFVARVVRAGADATCACFGARKSITAATVWRNAWYVLLGLAAAATAWAQPTWGGALVGLGASGWVLMLGLVATAVTVVLTMWPAPPVDAGGEVVSAESAVDTASTSASEPGEDEEYVRARTPAVPVTRADGEVVDLREVSMADRPVLLLHFRSGCGSCAAVHDRLSEIRTQLPEVDVRLLLAEAPDESTWTERAEPQSLHDPKHYVRNSLGEWGTPTALLLGTDGLLAGGPVSGPQAILDFVDDIYESLHGQRPARALGAVR